MFEFSFSGWVLALGLIFISGLLIISRLIARHLKRHHRADSHYRS